MRYFANEYDINTVNVDAISSKIENVIESFVHWVGSLDRSRDLRTISTGERPSWSEIFYFSGSGPDRSFKIFAGTPIF